MNLTVTALVYQKATRQASHNIQSCSCVKSIIFTSIILTQMFINLSNTFSQNQLPNASVGKIIRFNEFKSKYVIARNIDVWIPLDYNPSHKYAVLYMQDGQMLFDNKITWNNQSWNVDDTAQKLMDEGKTKKFIVVGIWNVDSTRHRDYFPQKPFESLRPTEQDSVSAQLKQVGRCLSKFQPKSDDYLRFIVSELKPFIEQNFSVKRDRSNNFIAGSSMGGLISIYALCEYPEVFGGAACISTHWPGTFTLKNNPFPSEMLRYLSLNLPDPSSHKIYFDCGDQTLDALYPEIQKKVNLVLKNKGYNSINNTSILFFPGDDHSEASWEKRLHFSLEFLFHSRN